ncbi:hypothetical protein BG011_007323 [Mortierella polycephala]|uniref:Uncharacterized protein n=1 Tax=Mortierella polycephala TaxID=41804 RepID=A0A9P6QBJ1_9FUNG|nr:hypothetical protein BG011_007323 [Mortierella polycephala]
MTNYALLECNMHYDFLSYIKFCEDSHDGYVGRALYLDDSVSKALRFFQETIFTSTAVKYVLPGIDTRSVVSAKPEEASPEQNADLAQHDGKGRKMIEISIGVENINMARRAMVRIHHLQQERNEVRIPGPAAMKELDSLTKHHQEILFEQSLQSSQIRSADCALRDSISDILTSQIVFAPSSRALTSGLSSDLPSN